MLGPVPGWFLVTFTVVVAANLLAGLTTRNTVSLMGGISRFAIESRRFEVAIIPYWNGISYVVAAGCLWLYLRPLLCFFRDGCPEPSPVDARRRALGGPLAIAAIGFSFWLASVPLFILVTVLRTGRWSTDLMSQQVLSPIVNGFLAFTTTYLVVDWVFRKMVVPRVFPDGRIARDDSTAAPGVLGRMLIFLTAVAFIPIFTLLGLVRSAAVRIEAGLDVATVLPALARASEITFVVYLLLGVGLTVLVGRAIARPLGEMAEALRRIEAGDLDAWVEVTSGDEVGVLAEGVNALATGLRDRDRIMTTFGCVVEPTVRDHLLAGELRLGGEERRVSILFCDLRGFTALSEHAPPQEIVSTLNRFFTAMTGWVRECDGYVDKFVGDGMVVVFGLFDPATELAEARAAAAAVRCAQGMRGRLETINAGRSEGGEIPLSLKVGVHSGEVVAGTIGATDRHQYTVIGDPVNVAARLEDLCSELGEDLLVSEETCRLARLSGAEVEATMTKAIKLRGRSIPIPVCAVSC